MCPSADRASLASARKQTLFKTFWTLFLDLRIPRLSCKNSADAVLQCCFPGSALNWIENKSISNFHIKYSDYLIIFYKLQWNFFEIIFFVTQSCRKLNLSIILNEISKCYAFKLCSSLWQLLRGGSQCKQKEGKNSRETTTTKLLLPWKRKVTISFGIDLSCSKLFFFKNL